MEADVAPGVLHRRSVYHRRGGFFVVHDSISSEEEHDYSWRLHLDGMGGLDDGRVTYRAPGGAGLIVVPAGPAPVRLEDTETVVFSDTEGLSSRPIQRAVMDTRGPSAAFAALLVPFKGEFPEVEAGFELEADRVVLQVRIDGSSHRLRMDGGTWQVL